MIRKIFSALAEKMLQSRMSEHMLREKALRAHDDFMSLVVETSRIGTLIWDFPSQTLEVSSRFREIFGLTQERIGPAEMLSAIVPQDIPEEWKKNSEAYEGKAQNVEFRVRLPDGAVRWVLLQGRPTADGRQFIGAVLDTTDRKNAEINLKARKDEMEMAIDLSGIGSWQHDFSGGVRLHWSLEARRIYDFKAEQEITPFAVMQRIHPDDRAMLEAARKASIRDQSDLFLRHRIIKDDGEIRWIEVRGRSIVDERTGNLLRTTGVGVDVTDRVAAENALKDSEARLRELADAVPNLIWTIAPTGEPTFFNRRWFEYTGLEIADYARENRVSVLHPDEQEESVKNWKEAREKGVPYMAEYRLRRADGLYRWHLSHTIPVRDAKGAIVKWIGTATDIDEQKQAEQRARLSEQRIRSIVEQRSELEVRERSALESARLKSEFLATMSHEIRTPINGVIGMTSLLLDTSLNQVQKQYAEGIKSSGDSLLTLINDILDFSKIEAGKLDFETIAFPLKQVLADVQLAVSYMAANKGLPVLCQADAALDFVLLGDPGRLKQILNNLLSNAIKFTSQGEVRIKVELLQDGDADCELRFAIQDSGIGLSEEAQAKLFTPFTQADSSTTRKFGGTGLGLSISKRLIECMGGTIGVESRLGEGSTFWFRMKLGKDQRKAEEQNLLLAALTPRRYSGRALVVDDVGINQVVAVRMLEKFGISSVSVSDGLEAVNALATVPYDIVFMDCHMPEMDGYEATRQIRAAEGGRRKTLIIAMTANAMQGDRDKCEAAGMDDYISKPFSPQKLEAVLRKWLKSTGAAA